MTATPDTAADAVIPEQLRRQLRVVGLRWRGPGDLLVGVSSDLSSEQSASAASTLSAQLGVRVETVPVDAAELDEVLSLGPADGSSLRAISVQGAGSGNEGPIAEAASALLERAVRLRASDVHFEPSDGDFIVRARIDGKLEEIARLPGSAAGPIVSRLKVLAEMNIVERRRPQDGQFRYTLGEKDIDVRLATISTIYGEKAVARLLDTRRTLEDVEGLGMKGEDLGKFRRLVSSHYGLIVVAGPTGAGKTTTLHSAISDLNKPDANVATLEDPVEYVVQGVNHIPVVDSIGVGFATQLRGLLRQDPDVIMVGEMRDEETARIGIQAALAGRLVLTSFHATDAVAAVYRLLQMGIEPHLVAASLRGVIAQRLLRRVCRYCKEEYSPSSSERLLLRDVTHEDRITVARGHGCTMCRGTGYRDRVGVFQIMEVTDELRELISLRPNPSELYKAATASGVRTLGEQAHLTALAKETSVLEASQLVGSDV